MIVSKNLITGRGVTGMPTTVQKWGNSLAIRIPSKIAESMLIDQGTEVELTVENHILTLKAKKVRPSLEELLAQITPDNKHYEVHFDVDGAEGNELL